MRRRKASPSIFFSASSQAKESRPHVLYSQLSNIQLFTSCKGMRAFTSTKICSRSALSASCGVEGSGGGFLAASRHAAREEPTSCARRESTAAAVDLLRSSVLARATEEARRLLHFLFFAVFLNEDMRYVFCNLFFKTRVNRKKLKNS